jgi:hypothetical protein
MDLGIQFRQILSLCDYSGVWSQPYVDAGYDVIRIDIQHGHDVRLIPWPGKVHGILAAPPCTYFCRPGARLWSEWGDAKILEGLQIVDACLRFVAVCDPAWWALENPPGRLDKYLGPPALSWHPWMYGDPYTKHTYLWGKFNAPVQTPVEPEPYPEHLPPGQRDRTSFLGSANKNKRAETPPGFARAFFLANP